MPNFTFRHPAKVNAGSVKQYLKDKDIDTDVTCSGQDDGSTIVTITSATDPTPVLGGFVPPEPGQKRRDLNDRIRNAKSIADVRSVLTDLLPMVSFADD